MTVVTSAQISYENQPGYNDCLLPTTNKSFLTPPTSTNLSSSSSSTTSLPTTTKVDLKDSIDSQLARLLALPTGLPDREFSHYKVKLTANLPRDLPLVQAWLDVLAEPEITAENQQQVRQQVIDYMLHHNGVSIWALPLRKVVESLVLAEK